MNERNMQWLTPPGASSFRFSAVRPDTLGATEYTLATIVVDTTASVSPFAAELKAAVVAVVESLRQSPRAEHLLVRLVTFNTTLREVFGFKALADIDPQAIAPFQPDGMTALFDASYEALAATEQYARLLYNQDFDTNASVYLITDGGDNHSQVATAAKVAELVGRLRQQEILESLTTTLIGINTTEREVQRALEQFAREGGLDQYIDVGAATPQHLARLAGYISRSISLQSQALGSGGASQTLTF